MAAMNLHPERLGNALGWWSMEPLAWSGPQTAISRVAQAASLGDGHE